MANQKELTLEELAKSAPNTGRTRQVEQPAKQRHVPEEGEKHQPEPMSVKSTISKEVNEPAQNKSVNVKPGSSHLRPISTSQLGRDLANRHPEVAEQKERERIGEDSPLFANAMDAMVNTIEERKKRIDQAMPYIAENAQSIRDEAIANNGVITDEDGNTETIEINKEDDHQDQVGLLSEVDQAADDDIFKELDEDEPKATESPAEMNIVYDNEPVNEAPKAEPNKEVKSEVNPIPTGKVISMQQAAAEKVKIEPDTTHAEDFDSLMQELGINEEVGLDDAEAETTDEIIAKVRKSFSSISIIKNPVNLAEFKIKSVPTSSSAILNNIGKNQNVKMADVALYYSERPMRFKECTGPELDNLYKTIQNSNALNGTIASIQFLYNHLVDANKPKFEEWAKMVRTEDIETLYFGVYKACYSDGNLLMRTCTNNKCKKTSLIDTPIDSMVKYSNDEVKNKINDIFRKDTTTPCKKIESKLLQISDDLVIMYSEPTIYKTFIQYASLKEEVLNKYSETLNMMAYIDYFFVIDRATQELTPIGVKEYPNDLGKTVISKLKVFIDVLRNLNTDQFNALRGKLDSLTTDESVITYVLPETTCPECGATIKEEDVSSCMSLLFTRAQLARVQNT